MSMRQDIYDELLPRLMADFRFKVEGDNLRKGECPQCKGRELFAYKATPWTLHCGRANKCGEKFSVKSLYPEIFDTWSNRVKPTPQNPNASAEAYLEGARGLKLLGLRKAFSQEIFKDYDRNMTSATVRFQLSNGAKWERLIDHPGRFDRKANFIGSYRGHVWMAPDQGLEVLARADRIWITEGIFDTCSWRQAGECSVAAMSTNNYPDQFLADLKKEIAAQNLRGPELIWAFDNGRAGVEYTRKYHAEAMKNGWRSTAAQPVPEDSKADHDWNDLLMAGKLTPELIPEYLWNGRLILADNATDKAILLWEKQRRASFHFIHDSRTWWASFDQKKITETKDKEEVTENFAARSCAEVTQIANCAFRVLYAQLDLGTGENHFFLDIDVHGRPGLFKARMSAAALTAGSEFKKALMGAAGALWEGGSRQLDRLVAEQTFGMKTVTALPFVGYSGRKDKKEQPVHNAWVLGDFAVQNGKVYKINAEDYFDLGSMQLKLASRDPYLDIKYDPDAFDISWVMVVWRAFGPNGMVVTVFWLLSFFAEQVRIHHHKSLGFVEMSGIPGTGKSTLIEFLWKLCGRDNYEGFDPSKATTAALARNLAKVANLPTVFMESDRADTNSHAKKFDWSEVKPFFNGRIVRSRGKPSGDNSTDESPFRSALIINQNAPVVAEQAVMERIIQMAFTKEGWSADTKEAATQLEHWPMDDISGTIIHIIRREKDILEKFSALKDKYEAAFLAADNRVKNGRIRLNHAQLHAALEAFAPILKLTPDILRTTHDHINSLAIARDQLIESDNETVAKFWDIFDHLEDDPKTLTPEGEVRGLNHSRGTDFISVNLLQFEQAVKRAGLAAPTTDELKANLKNSKSRPFVESNKVINSGLTHASVRCWVFRREPQKKGG
ncbi:toprim domain-containing protein [Asticcacaulis machinosus]|uniref:Toprim domain-containing protein n=1 Tax=Asticcacaulis machinosus TaxID=2984211 RepID=A0ABT5HGM1_9CAUL|nr:toprim domain-containing protein [Asticcacaulis machinosus]MDC7675403.1 toprim domain-containing protein [Asticcacaulis machinosus]